MDCHFDHPANPWATWLGQLFENSFTYLVNHDLRLGQGKLNGTVQAGRGIGADEMMAAGLPVLFLADDCLG